MNDPSAPPVKLRRLHPLVAALIRRMRPVRGASILEIGSGTGRNTRVLESAAFAVTPIADERLTSLAADIAGTRFDAAFSTHGLLHGSLAAVKRAVRDVAAALAPGAPFYSTFTSTRDARYGIGERIDPQTFVNHGGEEAGVPHVFFDSAHLREILSCDFTIESMQERGVDDVVGRWAHASPPAGTVHWFVLARRR